MTWVRILACHHGSLHFKGAATFCFVKLNFFLNGLKKIKSITLYTWLKCRGFESWHHFEASGPSLVLNDDNILVHKMTLASSRVFVHNVIGMGLNSMIDRLSVNMMLNISPFLEVVLGKGFFYRLSDPIGG